MKQFSIKHNDLATTLHNWSNIQYNIMITILSIYVETQECIKLKKNNRAKATISHHRKVI